MQMLIPVKVYENINMDMSVVVAVGMTNWVMVDAVPDVSGAEKASEASVHQKSADPATMVAALL